MCCIHSSRGSALAMELARRGGGYLLKKEGPQGERGPKRNVDEVRGRRVSPGEVSTAGM